MKVNFNPAFGIESVSGRLGDYIFRTRNGKTHMFYSPRKSKNRKQPSNGSNTGQLPVIVLPTTLDKS